MPVRKYRRGQPLPEQPGLRERTLEDVEAHALDYLGPNLEHAHEELEGLRLYEYKVPLWKRWSIEVDLGPFRSACQPYFENRVENFSNVVSMGSTRHEGPFQTDDMHAVGLRGELATSLLLDTQPQWWCQEQRDRNDPGDIEITYRDGVTEWVEVKTSMKWKEPWVTFQTEKQTKKWILPECDLIVLCRSEYRASPFSPVDVIAWAERKDWEPAIVMLPNSKGVLGPKVPFSPRVFHRIETLMADVVADPRLHRILQITPERGASHVPEEEGRPQPEAAAQPPLQGGGDPDR